MEKGLKLNAAKKFFNILLKNSSRFLDIGTKFKPLLKTDFSASESERFSGMYTLPLLFKQAIIAPNKLIGSQHYKRLRRRIIIEFHSPSIILFFSITL